MADEETLGDIATRLINDEVLFVAANGTEYDIYCMQSDLGIRAMEPVCEEWRCKRCTSELGPATSNARPHNGDMRGHQGRFSELTQST